MNKTLLSLVASACLLPSLASAQNYYQPYEGYRSFDGVVYTRADKGRRFSDGSKVVCEKIRVENRGSRDKDRVAGTIIGALIGGAVGNQVGGGSGKALATVGGAVAGGAIGRKVQGDNQERNGRRYVEYRCERVYRRR